MLMHSLSSWSAGQTLRCSVLAVALQQLLDEIPTRLFCAAWNIWLHDVWNVLRKVIDSTGIYRLKYSLHSSLVTDME